MIRGYRNWYVRTGDDRWRRLMASAADLQCDNLDPRSGMFAHAGHEDDRFCSLVHCALADIALLEASDQVDDERRARYCRVAATNIDRYCLERLWVPTEGAFRFSAFDHWSPHEDRFVVNFNTVGAEALLRLHAVTGEARYEDYALEICSWLGRRYRDAREYSLRTKKTGSSTREGQLTAPLGGLAYQYTASHPEPDNRVLIYGALALRGLSHLHQHTGDPEMAAMIRDTVDYTLAMKDPTTGLFYHTTDGNAVVRWPQFVAGCGMILSGLLAAKQELHGAWDWSAVEVELLSRQYSNGSFPGFIGKARPGANIETWEDRVATPSWNAQMFEYLTQVADPPAEIQPSPTFRLVSSGTVYIDSPDLVLVASIFPPGFSCLYLTRKREPYSILYWPIHEFLDSTFGRAARYARSAWRRLRLLDFRR